MSERQARQPAPFDVEALQRSLPTFDLNVRSPHRPEFAQYTAFFGLDDLGVPCRHDYGRVELYGYDIAVQVFSPEGVLPKGTLWVLHGYFDHVGLFKNPIREGLKAGYSVVSFDLPGHGLSHGFACEIPDFQHYQEVFNDLMALLQDALPKPWVAVGQSTGGAILLDHVLSRLARGNKPAFARVQLWAPLVRIAQWRKVKLSYALMGRFVKQVPRHYRRSSSDANFVDFIWHRDPFQHDYIPMRWLKAMMDWERHIHALPACRFPISLVQGDADETVDWDYNNRFVSEHCFVESRTLITGASHHLANESPEYLSQVLHALRKSVLI